MAQTPYNILILCTGNSARSIMAEALFNIHGGAYFRAYSAGSQPAGKVNPFALEKLAAIGYGTAPLRSKSWDEFAAPGAPVMDFIVTVCDNAAGETCPLWPGQPSTAHWGFVDPAAVVGHDEDKRAAFHAVFLQILNRVQKLMQQPLGSMDKAAIAQAMQAIGRVPV
jgi:arsenate reductase